MTWQLGGRRKAETRRTSAVATPPMRAYAVLSQWESSKNLAATITAVITTRWTFSGVSAILDICARRSKKTRGPCSGALAVKFGSRCVRSRTQRFHAVAPAAFGVLHTRSRSRASLVGAAAWGFRLGGERGHNRFEAVDVGKGEDEALEGAVGVGADAQDVIPDRDLRLRLARKDRGGVRRAIVAALTGKDHASANGLRHCDSTAFGRPDL